MINTFGLGSRGTGGNVILVGEAESNIEQVFLSSDIGGTLTSEVTNISVLGTQVNPLQSDTLTAFDFSSEI